MAGVCRQIVVLFAASIVHLEIPVTEGAAFEIVRDPNSAVKPGSSVIFTCSIRKNANPSMTVMWLKRVGKFIYTIGGNQQIYAPFDGSRRYSASGVQTKTDRFVSVLTIRGVSAEDIGEVGCQLKNSGSKPVYATLAVCDNPDSEVCRCIDRTGWAKPSCWEEPQSLLEAQAEFQRIIIGLSVCLVIAVIFGIILVIIIARDGILRLHARRAGNKPMVNAPDAMMMQNQDPYSNSEQLTVNPDEMGLEIVQGSAVKNEDPYAYRKNNLTAKNRVNTPNAKPNGGLHANPDGSYDNPGNLHTPRPYDNQPAILHTPQPYHGSRPHTPDSYNEVAMARTPQSYSSRASPQPYYSNAAASPQQQYVDDNSGLAV